VSDDLLFVDDRLFDNVYDFVMIFLMDAVMSYYVVLYFIQKDIANTPRYTVLSNNKRGIHG
jgi:hypothetical protein